MPKYIVQTYFSVYGEAEIEADSPEEARQEARNSPPHFTTASGIWWIDGQDLEIDGYIKVSEAKDNG